MIMSVYSATDPDRDVPADTSAWTHRAAELLGHPPTPPELRAVQLWLTAWARWRNRLTLQRHGFLFPPGSQGNADEDWKRFESWASGESLPWYYADRFPFPPAECNLSDEEVRSQLEEVLANLAASQVAAPKLDGPARCAYRSLREWLRRVPLQAVRTPQLGHCA